TSGVTLMSHIGPPPEFVENAIFDAPQCGRSLVATKPTLRMPCACAVFTTSEITWYLVVSSPRMLTAGCGVFCASTESWLSSRLRVTGWSFQYSAPSLVTVTVIGGAGGTFSSRLSRFAWG